MLQHRVRCPAGDLHVAAGLQQMHLVDDVQQEVRELVGAVAPVRQEPGQVEVGEVRVGAAFGGGHTHLGGRGVVVELHEEALQQLLRGVPGEGAFGQPLLVEGPEVLIQMAGAVGVPAVQFGDDGQVAEPVGLQGLVEVARGVGGNPAADPGDRQEFLLAKRIGRLRGFRLGQLRMPFSEAHDGVAGDGHGLELFPLVQGLRVLLEIEHGFGTGDVGLEVQHALPVELAVAHRVARGALLHELREASRLVGVVPFLRQLLEHLVPHGPALPEGDDLPLVGLDHARFDLVLRLLAGIQDPQILDAVAGQLRIGGHGLGPGSALAHDEFALAHPEGLLLADGQEVQGPEHGNAVPSLVLLVEGRGDLCPLGTDGGDRVQALLAQSLGAFVHGRPPMVVFRPLARKSPAMASRSSRLGVWVACKL